MPTLIDMTGRRFGNWQIIRRDIRHNWICLCDCGAEKSVDGRSLRAGRSGGCIKCHAAKKHNLTHGGRRTRLYNIWSGMKRRCGAPTDAAYPRYGGRGIALCGEWANDFAAFEAWSHANGYADHLTIDRMDNDLGYEPRNCRWATKAEQNRNYSRVHYVEYNGVRAPLIDFAERAGLKPYTVRQRIFRMGWSVDRALNTPVRSAAISFTTEQRNIDG